MELEATRLAGELDAEEEGKGPGEAGLPFEVTSQLPGRVVYLDEDKREEQKFLDSGEVKSSALDTSLLKLGVGSDA